MALPANYTSVISYDEITGEFLNNTNITIANATFSEDFNLTTFSYVVAENNTEVCIGPDVYSFTSVKTEVVDEYVREVIAKLRTGGSYAADIRAFYNYADGTSEASNSFATDSGTYIEYTLLNPHPERKVNNYSIQIKVPNSYDIGCSGNAKGSSYMTLSMENITTRGDSTILVKASGYENSKYYATLTENTTLDQTAYLLSTASAVSKQFTIQDTLGTVISNVKLTVKRFINDTWQVVNEEKTDSSGIAVLSLEEEILYSVTFSALGYVDLTQTYTGNTAQVLVTIATETGLVLDHQTDGIYWTMRPSVNALKSTENQTISFTALSDNSSLEDYSLLVYWTNGTVIYNQTTVSADGGTLSTTMNLTAIRPGRSIKAAGGFTKAGYSTFYINRTFYIHNATISNRTLFGLMPNFPEENNLGEIATTIIAVLTVLVVTGGIAATVGGVGAGIVGLLVLGMFTFLGWFSGGLFLAVLVVVLSIYYLRGG